MKKSALMIFAAVSLFSSGLAQNTTIDTVTITAPDPRASEAGPDPGLFEIRRSGPTNFALRVFYRVSGTASNGVDYETISEGVVIPQGERTALIPIKPIDDVLVEGSETVLLQIVPSPLLCPAPACGYSIGWPSNATVTIADNDHPPGVNIYATDPVATEQPLTTAIAPDTATFTVRRSDGTNETIVVYYALSGTASNGVDYENLSGQVTIPEGAWSADIVVTPIDDDLAEGAETIEISLLAPCPQCLFASPPCEVPQGPNCYPIGPNNKALAYIRDNDRSGTNRPPGVNIYATDPTATELPGTVAAAPDTATFTVRRSDGTNESIVVYYEIGGTAFNGVDYQKLSGEVAILAGAWSADIVVVPIDDNLVEGTETVEISLLAPCAQCLFANPPCKILQGTNCYPIGPDSKAVAFIRDNDSPPATNPPIVTIFASDPIAVEGQFCWSNWWWTTSGTIDGWKTNSFLPPPTRCSGSNTATFVVRRTGETSSDLNVYYLIGGTASNGVDYATLPGSVTIPAGNRTASIEIAPIDDSIPERIETVVLGLQPPPASGGAISPSAYEVGVPRRAAALILDNDQARPPCGRLSDGLFHLCVPGTNGYTFCIRTSTDLVNWSAVCTNVVTEGAVHFIDADAVGFNNRFYQVVPAPPQAPSQ